jgi:hypothetical protein
MTYSRATIYLIRKHRKKGKKEEKQNALKRQMTAP